MKGWAESSIMLLAVKTIWSLQILDETGVESQFIAPIYSVPLSANESLTWAPVDLNKLQILTDFTWV